LKIVLVLFLGLEFGRENEKENEERKR